MAQNLLDYFEDNKSEYDQNLATELDMTSYGNDYHQNSLSNISASSHLNELEQYLAEEAKKQELSMQESSNISKNDKTKGVMKRKRDVSADTEDKKKTGNKRAKKDITIEPSTLKSTISTISTTSDNSTFGECQNKVELCKSALKNVNMLSKNIDTNMKYHSDTAAREIAKIAEHYNKKLESLCCYNCKRSPDTNPQRVKAEKCGHYVCCLDCLASVLPSFSKKAFCPRCNVDSAIVIE